MNYYYPTNYLSKLLSFISIALLMTCSKDSDSPSCPKVSNINFSTSPTEIFISFSSDQEVNSFRIEYGLSGYIPGTGSSIITSNQGYSIQGLDTSTTYDIYITSICSAEDESNPASLLSVTTEMSQCQSTPYLEVNQFSLNNVNLSYGVSGVNVRNYEIEYGLEGFSIGSGTVITTDSFDTSFNVNNLDPSTTYDFYVRANCSDSGNDYGPRIMKQFTTLPYCPEPFNLDVTYISGTSCSSSLIVYRFDWDYYIGSNVVNFTVSTPDLGDPPTASQQFTTSNESISLQGFFCGQHDFYVKANCDDGSSSEWAGPFSF